jgi:hypothetical protein
MITLALLSSGLLLSCFSVIFVLGGIWRWGQVFLVLLTMAVAVLCWAALVVFLFGAWTL